MKQSDETKCRMRAQGKETRRGAAHVCVTADTADWAASRGATRLEALRHQRMPGFCVQVATSELCDSHAYGGDYNLRLTFVGQRPGRLLVFSMCLAVCIAKGCDYAFCASLPI